MPMLSKKAAGELAKMLNAVRVAEHMLDADVLKAYDGDELQAYAKRWRKNGREALAALKGKFGLELVGYSNRFKEI